VLVLALKVVIKAMGDAMLGKKRVFFSPELSVVTPCKSMAKTRQVEVSKCGNSLRRLRACL